VLRAPLEDVTVEVDLHMGFVEPRDAYHSRLASARSLSRRDVQRA
jgi:hypothetical protein